MRTVNLFAAICLTILSQSGIGNGSDDCSWETATDSKKYAFDLLTSSGHTYGARSEDGFYSVADKSADGTVTTYWFQLCEHMRFNYGTPKCDRCESCGGPLHCGETCSALQSISDGGYPYCITLGEASNYTFSLIDSRKPEVGIVVIMAASAHQKTCTFSVAIYCSSNSEQLPTNVTKTGSCDYKTSFYHSAGCPIVTSLSRGGMGWFTTFVIVLLCLFVVYLAIGIGYRVTVLGVTGLQAIPNLDFWKTLPHTIKIYVEDFWSFLVSCYRRFTEPTYIRVDG